MRLGNHQKRMLLFYYRAADWQGYSTDALTRRVAQRLGQLGLLELNEYNQAKITWAGILEARKRLPYKCEIEYH